MLIKKVTFYDFVQEFEKYERKNQFSYQGLKALFEYLEELSEDLGQPIELDVIGLCCEFVEYENLEAFKDDYGHEVGDDVNSIDDISLYTTVIDINGEAFIIQNF